MFGALELSTCDGYVYQYTSLKKHHYNTNKLFNLFATFLLKCTLLNFEEVKTYLCL